MSKPIGSKLEPTSSDEMVYCLTCGTMIHKNKATKIKDAKGKDAYTCNQE